MPVPLKGLNRLLRFMQDGRGARARGEQATPSGGDGKQVSQFAETQSCEHPPGWHYDQPARSSLTDDPDIMPGDEKRGRPPDRHRQRRAMRRGTVGNDRAHIRTGSASWRAVPFAFKSRREVPQRAWGLPHSRNQTIQNSDVPAARTKECACDELNAVQPPASS
jgi:hypothetical protein